MKRKLKWIVVVLVVLLAGFGTALFLWPRDRITADSWKQIRIGMTTKDVEGILDGPGMRPEYALGKYERIKRGEPLEEGRLTETETAQVWIGQRGAMFIGFDKECNVTIKNFQEFEPNCLAGEGRHHETKTEMDCGASYFPGGGAGNGIDLVAARSDYPGIVETDSFGDDGEGSGGHPERHWHGLQGSSR